MLKKVIVGCRDEEVKKIVYDGLKKCLPEQGICICETHADLYELAKYEDEVAIIFDKYFLGYVLTYQYYRIKVLNDKALTYFVETGECSRYFGLRIHELGINGLISFIENKDILKVGLTRIISGLNSYPETIVKSIEENDYLLDKKCCSEVTGREMTIGMYLGLGKSQKEICYLTGLTAQAVNTYIHRLKRKIGYKNPNDYALLNKQAFNTTERGLD